MQETLTFHRLTFAPERDGIMVGRPDIESYAVLPEDGARLLRVLADGMPVAAAADWYKSTFGESVDMGDFVAALTDLGFVRRQGEGEAEASPVKLQALGRALFSPFAWVCYALLAAATVFVTVRSPELRPAPGNVFFVSYLVVVQLVVMVLGVLVGTLFHEWFHAMAGRRRGLPSRITVRMIFQPIGVFETELNGLLGLPRRQRYVPFLAGMVADMVFFSGLTLAAAGLRSGPHWLWQMLLAVAYVNLLRPAWQLALFMRTDPYYALITALGCVDLTGATRDYLRHKIGRHKIGPLEVGPRETGGKRSSVPGAAGDAWTPREKALAPWFTLLNVIGVSLLTAIMAFGFVPVAVGFFRRVAGGFIHYPVTSPHFWDSVAVVAVLIVDTVIGSMIVRLARRLLHAVRLSGVTPAIPSPDAAPRQTG